MSNKYSWDINEDPVVLSTGSSDVNYVNNVNDTTDDIKYNRDYISSNVEFIKDMDDMKEHSDRLNQKKENLISILNSILRNKLVSRGDRSMILDVDDGISLPPSELYTNVPSVEQLDNTVYKLKKRIIEINLDIFSIVKHSINSELVGIFNYTDKDKAKYLGLDDIANEIDKDIGNLYNRYSYNNILLKKIFNKINSNLVDVFREDKDVLETVTDRYIYKNKKDYIFSGERFPYDLLDFLFEQKEEFNFNRYSELLNYFIGYLSVMPSNSDIKNLFNEDIKLFGELSAAIYNKIIHQINNGYNNDDYKEILDLEKDLDFISDKYLKNLDIHNGGVLYSIYLEDIECKKRLNKIEEKINLANYEKFHHGNFINKVTDYNFNILYTFLSFKDNVNWYYNVFIRNSFVNIFLKDEVLNDNLFYSINNLYNKVHSLIESLSKVITKYINIYYLINSVYNQLEDESKNIFKTLYNNTSIYIGYDDKYGNNINSLPKYKIDKINSLRYDINSYVNAYEFKKNTETYN